jgi:hypothetical protein
MPKPLRGFAAAAAVVVVSLTACRPPDPLDDSSWRLAFDIADCAMTPTGHNDYLILEPGHQLVLEGGNEKLVITVLDDTKEVDDVLTRVVEEREWRDGELIEVSRNFFAMCIATKDIFYFGEQVDDYRDGKIVSHAGAWLKTQEGTALNPREKEFKVYAPGVGLLQDGTMLLTEYGFVEAQ